MSNDRTASEPSSGDPGGARAAWPIAFAVVLVLLIAALVYIALTRRGEESGTSGTSSLVTTSTSLPASTTTTAAATTTSTGRSTTSRAATTTTTSASASTSSSTSSTAAPATAPCTAAALLAAVPQDEKADGASVQTFACTPTTGTVADGFAWARLVAPNVDALIVFYNVVPDVQPGRPTVSSWQVISYGSAIVCEDFMPVEACDLLTGIPRR